jgi:hypothetical protein
MTDMAHGKRTGTRAAGKTLHNSAARTPKHKAEGRFEPGAAVMEDPLAPGRKARVQVNLRHDVLTHWHARGLIDAAQFAAGRRFQSLWHRSEIGAGAAIRLDRPRVDGGLRSDPISEWAIEARNQLSALAALLGMIDYPLMSRVVGQGRPIEEEGASGAWGTREPQLYIGRRLRDALSVLADHWGARGRDRAPMRAERIGE